MTDNDADDTTKRIIDGVRVYGHAIVITEYVRNRVRDSVDEGPTLIVDPRCVRWDDTNRGWRMTIAHAETCRCDTFIDGPWEQRQQERQAKG